MHMTLTGLLLVLLGFPADQSRPAGAEAEIARLEAEWNDSHVKGDGAALDRLWADDFTVAVPAMRMMSKADVIGVWRTGRMKFQRYETSTVRIRVYGDAAVVTGRVQRTRDLGGRPVDDDWLFTKTYARLDGAWKVVAFHASPFGG